MLKGRQERLLDGLLGKIEVPQLADEDRDRPPGFLAEDPVDDGTGVGLGNSIAARVGRQTGSSQMGRTSIAPYCAPGIFAASSMASSRSFTSSR